MQYNTKRQRIAMPEYGRTVQQMVEHCITIPNADRRQRCAQSIIAVMASMQTAHKEQPEMRRKLWDHLAYISGYRLEIDYPYPVRKMEHKDQNESSRVPYPSQTIHNRHYGHLNEAFLSHLASMNKGEERDLLTGMIANQMKQSLYDWNREVADDTKVANDLAHYTGGLVKLDLDKFEFDKVIREPKPSGKKKHK